MGNEEPFNQPRLALNRIYTRRGDKGETSLVGGQRVAKDSLRIECYGTIDELNAFVGAACLAVDQCGAEELALLGRILKRVQHELFNLGSILATLPQDVHPKQPQVTETDVSQLEREIDLMNEDLPALRSFVLPGGSEVNVRLHQCRTVCRRAERIAVALSRSETVSPSIIHYLNRLSDALFVWSRWANLKIGVPEVLWSPNEAASGKVRGEAT
jgi:cob(I)alamin adenosyltransferase